MSLIYPNHIQILRPRRLIGRQKAQILEPQGSVWALGLDGVDSKIVVPHSASLNLGALTDSYSVGAWFRKTSAAQGVIIAKNHPASGNIMPFFLDVYLGKVRFIIREANLPNINVSSNQSNYDDNKWHFAAGTRDVAGGVIRVDVDGTDSNSKTDTITSSMLNTIDVWIGSVNTSGGSGVAYFPGLLTDVFISNALSTNEAANLYERVLRPDELPGLVGWWRFQEGLGSANGTVIRDWSGQGNHGSMQAFSGNPWVNVGVR